MPRVLLARTAVRTTLERAIAIVAVAAAPVSVVGAQRPDAPPVATRSVASRSVATRSPDGRLAITVAVDSGPAGPHAVGYRVTYRGAPLVGASALGLDFLETGAWGGDVRVAGVRRAAHDGVVTGLLGKASSAREHYREAVVALVERPEPHRRIDLVVRAYDDGVAFRYRVPPQAALRQFTIRDERTHVVLDPASRAWVLPRAGFVSSYEGFYTAAPLREIAADTLLALPVLTQNPGGAWLAVTEAALTDYAGLYLVRHAGSASGPAGAPAGDLVSRLSPLPNDTTAGDSARVAVRAAVRGRAPLATPWRVLLVGDAPGRLIESELVTLLNPPSRIADASWIRPGKTTFPWWNDYVVPDTVRFRAGLNTATAKYYIDFCAAHGVAYHTLDGYQDSAWYGGTIDPGGRIPDVTRGRPGLDLDEVLRYARQKGVRLRVWTHWKALKPQLDTALARYARLGIEGVMVDFMDRDDQEMLAFYQDVVRKAAARHLTVVFHGVPKPTGVGRTWPNLLTVEGVMGLEYDKFDGARGVTPSHEVTVPFTRMLAGPLDFHQGGFRYATERDFHTRYTGPSVIGTRARTLATYVVYDDPLPMMADAPASYEGQPGLDFVAAVPTTWDETRAVDGRVGAFITLARRRGRTWYVGTMTDGSARDVAIPLRFLGPGAYTAEVYADSAGALDRVRRETRRVTAADTLRARLLPAGGHAVRLTPDRSVR